MPELIWLYRLLIRRKPDYFHRCRIFNRYFGTIGVIELHEKFLCFHGLLKPFRHNFSVYSHSDGPSVCHVSTRWVGNNQIPFQFEQLRRVYLKMPFRVSTAARLNIAAISLMPQLPERLTNLLRFLAGYQNLHRFASWSPRRALIISLLCSMPFFLLLPKM